MQDEGNNPEFRAGLIPRWLDAHQRARVAQRRAERAEAKLAGVIALLDKTEAEAVRFRHLARVSTREVRDAMEPVYDEDQFDGYNEIGAMG